MIKNAKNILIFYLKVGFGGLLAPCGVFCLYKIYINDEKMDPLIEIFFAILAKSTLPWYALTVLTSDKDIQEKLFNSKKHLNR